MPHDAPPADDVYSYNTLFTLRLGKLAKHHPIVFCNTHSDELLPLTYQTFSTRVAHFSKRPFRESGFSFIFNSTCTNKPSVVQKKKVRKLMVEMITKAYFEHWLAALNYRISLFLVIDSTNDLISQTIWSP